MCEHERGETGIESKRCVVGNARNAAAYDAARRGVATTSRPSAPDPRGRRPRSLVAPAPARDRVRVRPEHCRVMSRLITYGSSTSRFGHLAALPPERRLAPPGVGLDTNEQQRTNKGNRYTGPGGGFPSCPQYLLATGTVCALCSPVAPSMLGVLLLGTSARALSPATVVEFSSNRFNSQTSSFFCDIFLLFFFFFFFFCPPPKGLCFRSRSSTSNWSVDFAGIFSPEPSSP